MRRQHILQVEEHMLCFAQCANGLLAHLAKLPVGNDEDDVVVRACLGLLDQCDAIFVLCSSAEAQSSQTSTATLYSPNSRTMSIAGYCAGTGGLVG